MLDSSTRCPAVHQTEYPPDWPEFIVEYRYGMSVYVIVVKDPAGRMPPKARSHSTVRLCRAE
jgi:hypothetical protein